MTSLATVEDARPSSYEDVTLLDLVDRLLDRGVVLTGDIVLSIAGIDLVHLSVRALLASTETLAGRSEA